MNTTSPNAPTTTTSLNALPKLSHPTFTVTIPSSKTEIKICPYLSREEKILLIAKEGGDASEILRAVKQVVNNCLIDKLDINRLPLFDLEYIFLRLHAVSVSNKIKLTYRDNEDNKDRTFDVDLDTVKVKFPDEDRSDVPVSTTVHFKLHYPEAAIYDDKEFMSLGGERALEALTLRCVDKIYDADKIFEARMFRREALQKWLDDLPVAAYDAAKKFFTELPSLHHEITYVNDQAHERKIVLSTLNDFFTLR